MKKSSSLILAVASAAAVAVVSSCKPSTPTVESSASPSPAPESAPATPGAAAPAEAAATETVTEVEVELQDPVATVNGEAISKAELNEAFDTAVKAAGVPVTELTADQKMEGYRQLLDEMILDKLITKAAAGVTVSQEEVDKEIATIKSKFPTEEAFAEQLAQAGQSPDKFGESLKKMMQQQKWLESQIEDKTAVSDADAKKFYEENQAEFQEGETVTASHILFMVKPDATEEETAAQLEAAKKAIARAEKEDFTALAKELSEEPGAAESGGDLGSFTKDRMVPEFAEAAFTQEIDVVSAEPVKTDFGYHVIKVTEKKEARTVPFEEVKDQLTSYLKSDKQRKAVKDLLDSLKSEAKIENTLPEPPPAPTMPGMPGMPQMNAAPVAEPAVEPAASGN